MCDSLWVGCHDLEQSLEVSTSLGPSVATRNAASLGASSSSSSHCLGQPCHQKNEPRVRWHLAGTASEAAGGRPWLRRKRPGAAAAAGAGVGLLLALSWVAAGGCAARGGAFPLAPASPEPPRSQPAKDGGLALPRLALGRVQSSARPHVGLWGDGRGR